MPNLPVTSAGPPTFHGDAIGTVTSERLSQYHATASGHEYATAPSPVVEWRAEDIHDCDRGIIDSVHTIQGGQRWDELCRERVGCSLRW